MDRSSRIIRKLGENFSLPKKGLLLDIGGGHGHFAALFREACPLWRATVADKSDHQIEEQPVAVQYANDLHDLKPDSFDLITLIHTLKHLPVPVSTLRKAHELLRPGGYCLVQTPNTAASLWDCIIYDHISHFTRASLVTAMEKSYFRSIVVSNNLSERELTFIGQKGLPTSNEKNQGFLELSPIPSENSDSVTREINQYLKLLLRLQSAVSLSLKSDLMLAGAGIGSSWFLAYTSIEILALVDEDANKCGRTWMDKKIVSPRQVPVDHIVIIPFTQDESARIRQRWRDEYGVNCVWIGDLLA
jgi:2-polyprenyl-3-methyl-5-hydroxy-6-metoxy-1,4-benzoquinol methylase